MVGTQCTVDLCVYCVSLDGPSDISPLPRHELWEALCCTRTSNTINIHLLLSINVGQILQPLVTVTSLLPQRKLQLFFFLLLIIPALRVVCLTSTSHLSMNNQQHEKRLK